MTSHISKILAAGILISGLSAELSMAQTDSLAAVTSSNSQIVEVSSAIVTLPMALRAAELSNPRIQAAEQGYEIRKTDIRLARSGWLPVVEANAGYGYLHQDNEFTLARDQRISGTTSNVGISMRQPLFRGNQVKNAVARATSTASAAEAEILEERQQVFLEVATAYFDVQRDLAILRLNLESMETLQEQLFANEKRYALKDASLTDVARSKAAVATAFTRIATARASYAGTRSVFFRLTGLPAENLPEVATLPRLHDTPEAAMAKIMETNASIATARLTLEASEFAVKEAKGMRLPSIDLNSSLSRVDRPENFGMFSDDRTTTAASASVSIRVPIFQADQEYGSIKRAKQVKQYREIELTQAIANVRDRLRITWDRLEAAKIALSSHHDAVEASELAAVGTREIYRSGLISAIDLTETERILLEAKVGRVRAEHELQVLTYNLLSLTGEITPI